MTTKRLLVVSSSVLIVAAIKMSAADQGASRSPEVARFENFAGMSDHARRYFYVSKPEGDFEIDQERLGKAVKNSAAWIRAVLKDQFVPEDLNSLIEGIPAALDGFDRDAPSLGRWPRFDCTRVEFESGGHHFLVIQNSMAVVFFVTSAKYADRAGTNASDFHSRVLRDWVIELFRHAEVNLYLRPIHLTDFGVDTATPRGVWNDLDKRWGPTVVKPPKAWEDGLISPIVGRFGNRDGLAAKLREIDPTMPEGQLEGLAAEWWRSSYAATDGRVLFYALPKDWGIFQGSGPAQVPDWFRVIDPAEIPMSGTDKTGAPATRADRANDPPN